MSRLAHIVLALLVAWTTSATCLRPAMACHMKRQVSHECCDQTSLSATTCCCDAAARHGEKAPVVSRDSAAVAAPAQMLAFTPVSPVLMIDGLSRLMVLTHGPAPPDDPISSHTKILC